MNVFFGVLFLVPLTRCSLTPDWYLKYVQSFYDSLSVNEESARSVVLADKSSRDHYSNLASFDEERKVMQCQVVKEFLECPGNEWPHRVIKRALAKYKAEPFHVADDVSLGVFDGLPSELTSMILSFAPSLSAASKSFYDCKLCLDDSVRLTPEEAMNFLGSNPQSRFIESLKTFPMGGRLESFFEKTDVQPFDKRSVLLSLRNSISTFGNLASDAYIQSRSFSDDNTAYLLQFLWVLAHRESHEEALTSFEKYSRVASLDVASFNTTIAKRACALLQDGNALHRHERVMLVKMLLRAINTIKRELEYGNSDRFFDVDILNMNRLHKIMEWFCTHPGVVHYNMCGAEKSDRFYHYIRELMAHLSDTLSESPIEIFKSILTSNRDHVIDMTVLYLNSLTYEKQVECLETLDIEGDLLMELWCKMESIDKASLFIRLLASPVTEKRQALLEKWKGIDDPVYEEGARVFRPMWGMKKIMGLLEDDRILKMLSPEQRALAIANGRALMEMSK